MFLSLISIIGPHLSLKSNCVAFNYSFSVRDSMEGWREAVLAVDAFLGWKQVLASFSFNPDFFSPGVAPSGDCRHHHSSLFDHLVHRSVPLNQYQQLLTFCATLLIRSKSSDAVGNHRIASYPRRLHWTKGGDLLIA